MSSKYALFHTEQQLTINIDEDTLNKDEDDFVSESKWEDALEKAEKHKAILFLNSNRNF